MNILQFGALAQLARAPALQAGGQEFESLMLHHFSIKSSLRSFLFGFEFSFLKKEGSLDESSFLVLGLCYYAGIVFWIY